MNKITIDLEKFTQEKRNQILALLDDDYTLSLTGKEKSEKTEIRMRRVLQESRPDTTDYDFRSGQGYFFANEKVELKQFDAEGKQPKLQQVKPELYDKIIVIAEYQDKALWYLLHTDKISKLAGKNHKEPGKLALNSQHKGNAKEGQISFNKTFLKNAIYITQTSKIDYRKDDLGITDDKILEILEFTKNH
jgi:hypothetical protein